MPFLKCNVRKVPRSRAIEQTAHKQGLRHAIVTPLKDTYKGEWNVSRKEGYGQMVTRSWRLYEGQWWSDFRHNYGTAAWRNDDKVYIIEYRGNWRRGLYSGYGELHYRDESFYKGYFKNSKRHGYGQMWYADGSFYDGDWLRDLRDGLGLFVFCNGNRYEGYWKEDVKHGTGRYFHLDSGQMQDGVWDYDICVSSYIEDIPFRQTSIYPTAYPIMENKLEDPIGVYKKRIEEVLYNQENPQLVETHDAETITIK